MDFLIVIIVLMAIIISQIINYRATVNRLQGRIEQLEDKLMPANTPIAANATMASASANSPTTVPAAEDGIPAEIIAAISAAVYMMYGSSTGRVTSIRRAVQPNRSAWKMAGMLENTRPF